MRESVTEMELEIILAAKANHLTALQCQETLTYFVFSYPWSIPRKRLTVEYFLLIILYTIVNPHLCGPNMMLLFQMRKLKISVINSLREGIKLTHIPFLLSPCSLSKPRRPKLVGWLLLGEGLLDSVGGSNPVLRFLYHPEKRANTDHWLRVLVKLKP